MHKSRLGGLIIDCEGGNLEESARFWGQALGYDAVRDEGAEGDIYRRLVTQPDEPHIEVQRVDHPSRVHIDIEADDIEAEVKRLEAIGAKRIGDVKSWVVMEAPTGHRFCVVRPQRADFDAAANVW